MARSTAEGRGENGPVTSRHSGCTAHSAVLSMKELFTSQDLSGSFVRLSNQLDSGRRFRMYEDALVQLVKERFRYCPVSSLPPEAAEWAAHSKRVLDLSRGACDLDEESTTLVLLADSGDWRDPLIKHWCVPGCALGCGRDATKSLELCKGALKLSLGGRIEKCLAYKWKGVDKASGKVYRGRKRHDLLLASFARTYPQKVAAKAQE